MGNCLTHLSSRLIAKDLEITRLNSLASSLEDENRQMNDEVNRQREKNRKITDTNRRQRLQINSFVLKWRSESIKFSSEKFDVLETVNKELTAFAQLFYSLESNDFFGIQILEWNTGSWIVIGLRIKQSYNPPGEGSIAFSSYGTIHVNGTSEKVGKSWQNNDSIHCGIKFSLDTNNVSGNFTVMFLRNGKRVIEKCIQVPSVGLYPSICMWNAKIKYFNNQLIKF